MFVAYAIFSLYYMITMIVALCMPEWRASASDDIGRALGSILAVFIVLIIVGIFAVRYYLKKQNKSGFEKFLFILTIPVNLLGLFIALLEKNMKDFFKREGAFGFFAGFVITFIMESLFIGSIIEGIVNKGGGPTISIAVVLLTLAGSAWMIFSFMGLEPRKKIDFVFFYLCIPCLLFGAIYSLFGFGVFKFFTMPAPTQSTSDDKEKSYKISKDVAGYDKIYDNDGREVTGIEFISDDGRVFGRDGNTYESKE